MEYFWYIVASIGAGVGTGLAGLSAATVMVPILLVLCPSFHGEVGAYQATAIALASDILGSAVTTWTYIKHKNIDLKRGWIMLVCIVSMCIGGSFAAFQAGNVVLGGFYWNSFPGKAGNTEKECTCKRQCTDEEGYRSFSFLWSHNWFWYRLCWNWRRYDDADRIYSFSWHGSQNSRGDQHFYYDIYGIDRCCQSYGDRADDRFGAMECFDYLHYCNNRCLTALSTVCKQS